MELDLGVDLEGDFKGDFIQDLEGDLLSSSGQLISRSGQYRLKFNSFELDSEVGRLVYSIVSVKVKKAKVSNLKINKT